MSNAARERYYKCKHGKHGHSSAAQSNVSHYDDARAPAKNGGGGGAAATAEEGEVGLNSVASAPAEMSQQMIKGKVTTSSTLEMSIMKGKKREETGTDFKNTRLDLGGGVNGGAAGCGTKKVSKTKQKRFK